MIKSDNKSNDFFSESYHRAIALLKECSIRSGFLASPTHQNNYRRIWGRDGVIIGLAALLSGEEQLRATFRRTLETLAEYQGPHGEIPSNVDPESRRISYGGMTGRVDADLWFIIGCGEYWLASGDDNFIRRLLPAIEKVQFLLGAWEFNTRGLLYIPQSGDWADEYIHNGYILYDQLLYLQSLRVLQILRTHLYGSADHSLAEKISRLKHLICANYWLLEGDRLPDDVYHKVLYQKGRKAAHRSAYNYWLPFFSPHGYGYRFDAFANILASLFEVTSSERQERLDGYIEAITVAEDFLLLPAFYPVVMPVDEDWEHLQMTFAYTFKNKPYQYHNAGRWPMLTGFYVAELARRDKKQLARRYLDAINHANALEMDGDPWSFPEYVHGKDGHPGGTKYQAWSAAGAIIGYHALQGLPVFRSIHHVQ